MGVAPRKKTTKAAVNGLNPKLLPSTIKSGKGALLPSLAKRYTDEQMVEAIYDCCGIKTQMCFKLDCTQNQLDKWFETHAQFKEHLVKAREKIVNLAEEVILQSLRSPDEKIRLEAAKTTLRQLGRNYGWCEVGQPALQLSVQEPKDGKDKTVEVRAIFGLPPSE